MTTADTVTETPENAAENSEYVLRVKATDPSRASETVVVVITVNNVNEAPEFDMDSKDQNTLYIDENRRSDTVPGLTLRTVRPLTRTPSTRRKPMWRRTTIIRVMVGLR